MTAATATQSRTEGQCANGADTVTMTPTATAIVQTALALTTTVTTVGTHSNEKCKLYPQTTGEKRRPGSNLKDDKAVTEEDYKICERMRGRKRQRTNPQ